MYKPVLFASVILILSIISGSGFTQVESSILGDDGDSFFHTESNGSSPNLLSVIIYEKSGPVWSAKNKYFYSYDHNDSLVEIIFQKLILGNWTDINRITYAYEPSGRHIERLTELNMSVGGWTNTTKMVFIYSSIQGPSEIHSYNWDNSSWNKIGIDYYKRSLSGDPTELIRMFKLLVVMEYTDRYTYFYDMNNLLTLTVGDFWTGDWSTVERTANRYNSNGDIVETLRENWRQGGWHNTSLDSISYDSLNRKAYHISRNWFNDAWINSTNRTYTYGDDGNLQKKVTQKQRNDQWEDQEMIIYSWDVVSSTDSDEDPPLPTSYQLEQNYPNPFNPSTSISFSINQRSDVTLSIFNVLGQEVAKLIDREMEAGDHTIEWDGTDANGTPLASGVFFYRLTVDDKSATRKMLLIK